MYDEREGGVGDQPGVIDQFITTQRIIDSSFDPKVDRFMSERDLNVVYGQLSPRDLFPFHNADHSLNVWIRGEKFLDIYKAALHADPSIKDPSLIITPKVREVHRVGSQGHDYRVRAKMRIDDKGLLVLQQYIGISEEETARLIREYMLSENRRRQSEYYTEQDIKDAEACAYITVPYITSDGKVSQPNLRKGMPLAALATAFGDLGAVVDGAGRFIDSSNDYFAERQLGLHLAFIRASQGGKPLSPQERDEFVTASIGYSQYQVEFLKARKRQLKTDVRVIPHASARQSIYEEYKGAHDRAIDAMKSRRDHRLQLVEQQDSDWFRKLVWDMGFRGPLLNAA